MKSQREIFAENLQKLLELRNVDQKELAEFLDVSETAVSYWTQGKKYPRIDKIQMMADYLRVSKTDLIEERATNLTPVSPQTVAIPILGEIACGDPIHADENFRGYRYKSPDNLPSGTLYILEARGSSMEPTIPNGAEVLIREQAEVETGEIAAVLVNSDTEATLKRIRRQNGVMMLMPDNTNYNPIIVSEEHPVKIIGKVVSYEVKL